MATKTQVTIDTKPLKDLAKQLEKFQKVDMEKFYEDCAKALAARLLSRVIKLTPVGHYMGGTLRRGWTGGSKMSGTAYAKRLPIYKTSKSYYIMVSNPVRWAPYVEHGHRQTPGRFVPGVWRGDAFVYKPGHKEGMVLKKAWVPGVFMLTISTREVEALAPALLEKMLLTKLKEVFA